MRTRTVACHLYLPLVLVTNIWRSSLLTICWTWHIIDTQKYSDYQFLLYLLHEPHSPPLHTPYKERFSRALTSEHSSFLLGTNPPKATAHPSTSNSLLDQISITGPDHSSEFEAVFPTVYRVFPPGVQMGASTPICPKVGGYLPCSRKN